LIEDVTSRFVASCPVTRSLRKPSRHGQATVESHLCCPRAPKQATVIYAIIPLLRLEEKKNGRSIDDSFARTRLRHLHDSRKQHRVNICACILGTNERPRSASRGSAALAPILGLGVHVGEPPLELTVVGAGPLYVEMVSALPDAVEEPVLALLSGTSNSVSSDKSQVNIMEKKLQFPVLTLSSSRRAHVEDLVVLAPRSALSSATTHGESFISFGQMVNWAFSE
jgi:hypothetical protein